MDHDWSSIPSEILDKVFGCLNDSDADRVRVGAVCSSWHSAWLLTERSAFKMKLPLLCGCYGTESTCRCQRNIDFTSLSKTSVYVLSSSSSASSAWLIRVVETKPNVWSLLDPCTERVRRPQPKRKRTNFNLLDGYQILHVAEVYTISHNFMRHQRRNIVADPLHQVPNHLQYILPVIKAVAVPNSKLALVMIYETDGRAALALWSGGEQWTRLDYKYNFEDIISHDGVLYAVDRSGKLYQIKPSTRELLPQTSTSLFPHAHNLYLVSSDGFLYVVVRELISSVPPIRVCVFDKQDRAWKGAETLGDKVFFVICSTAVTFSLSSKDLGWSYGNRIYLLSKAFECRDHLKAYRRLGCEFGKISGVYKLEGAGATIQVDISDQNQIVIWPPPAWILSDETASC